MPVLYTAVITRPTTGLHAADPLYVNLTVISLSVPGSVIQRFVSAGGNDGEYAGRI